MRPERARAREDSPRFFEASVWRLPPPLDPDLVRGFSREAGVIQEVASILLRRWGCDRSKALSFLRDGPLDPLPDPLSLPAMPPAVRRLQEAKDRGERVVIYSDYDCDGVTSAVVLSEALERAGVEHFEVYFPSRTTEGYGFHKGSALELAERGASLFVTADCGISGHEACEALAALGKDVIITDHHLPGTALPQAVSVIDPHLPAWEGLGLAGLSGAGVAYMLSKALLRFIGVEMEAGWAHDLLTLSIAGDGQPVTGPNRVWVMSGLKRIGGVPRVGIHALMRVAGLVGDDETAPRRLSYDRDVTFGLVPRINAAGRLSDPRLAFELLSTFDPSIAAGLAAELDSLNRQRREIEDRILEECWQDLPDLGYAMCAHRPGWHEGVIGIACSRIREATGRPVALAAGEGDILKGSVRGVPGFNVVDALRQCGGMLTAFGGHEAAGGFSVHKDRVSEFFSAFDAVTREILEEGMTQPAVPVDEVLAVGQATGEVLDSLLGLGPFGDGNPVPSLVSMDCEVVSVGLMGSTLDHVQVVLGKGGVTQRFLWFGQGRNARELALLGSVDVLFTPYRSVYRGAEQFSPLVREVRPSWAQSGAGYEGLVKAIPPHAPVIIYTWSEHVGRSIRTAFSKLGRLAHVHLRDQAGAAALEARAVLRDGGAVISTAPWDLGLRGGLPRVMVLHLPLEPGDEDRLGRFLGSARTCLSLPGWREDAHRWLSWTYPDKERLRCLWKFLTQNYGDGRVPACHLGQRWSQALKAAGYSPEESTPDGGRVFLRSGLTVFEEVGLAAYDTKRRIPEFVLRLKGDRVDLQGSDAYMRGEQARRRAAVVLRDEVEG